MMKPDGPNRTGSMIWNFKSFFFFFSFLEMWQLVKDEQKKKKKKKWGRLVDRKNDKGDVVRADGVSLS